MLGKYPYYVDEVINLREFNGLPSDRQEEIVKSGFEPGGFKFPSLLVTTMFR